MATNEELKRHQCERSESWWEYDARGIPLARVCDICRDAKLGTFRRDVLEDPNYECDEAIDES